ncbi:type II toxin-antitoxin system Phd/YefM family antitoxin [Paractinoplanes rishiriensis]|nr:type II toxin-antitoxin system Phd/YefM family antitoxin [Actinoplanes rishiriensis]
MRWQVQEAKQRFSELLRAAASGEPQIVTKHGEEIAVVLTMSEYRRLKGERMSFTDYLLQEPQVGIDFDFERSRELPREVDLSE